jgi:hypothetical protein
MRERWEYKLINAQDAEGGGLLKGKSRADVEAYLNELGKEGWEVIDLDFPSPGSSDVTLFAGIARRRVAD